MLEGFKEYECIYIEHSEAALFTQDFTQARNTALLVY